MQNKSTNELEPAGSAEELEKILADTNPSARGPTFEVGEVIKIKGYYYRVKDIIRDSLIFTPHGPSREGMKTHPKDELRDRAADQLADSRVDDREE